MHRAVEPRLRRADLVELRVEFHKGILHDILRDREIAEQPARIGQQRRLQGGEDLLDRRPFRRGRIGFLRRLHRQDSHRGGMVGIMHGASRGPGCEARKETSLGHETDGLAGVLEKWP